MNARQVLLLVAVIVITGLAACTKDSTSVTKVPPNGQVLSPTNALEGSYRVYINDTTFYSSGSMSASNYIDTLKVELQDGNTIYAWYDYLSDTNSCNALKQNCHTFCNYSLGYYVLSFSTTGDDSIFLFKAGSTNSPLNYYHIKGAGIKIH
ncbi:MAG TPA: hypothetical protein VG603_04740 [Chitinophagales bacterium]|nr:hypothetical protein [Chitinophagales bacterium]